MPFQTICVICTVYYIGPFFSRDISRIVGPSTKIKIRERVVCVVNEYKMGVAQSRSAKYKTGDIMHLQNLCPSKKGPTVRGATVLRGA